MCRRIRYHVRNRFCYCTVLGISDGSCVLCIPHSCDSRTKKPVLHTNEFIGELCFLSTSLAIVLGFLDMKKVSVVVGYNVTILPWLGGIVDTLGADIGLGLTFPKPNKAT